MSKNIPVSGGIDFFGLLTIVFIVLKLTHYIDWSWWWVLSPSLFPLAILFLIAVGAAIFLMLAVLKQTKGKYQ